MQPGIPAPSPELKAILRTAFFATVCVVSFSAGVARHQLTRGAPGGDAEAFWRANFRRVVPLWAVAEAGAIAGVVLAWLSGVTFMAVWLPGLALFALVLARPGTLEAF